VIFEDERNREGLGHEGDDAQLGAALRAEQGKDFVDARQEHGPEVSARPVVGGIVDPRRDSRSNRLYGPYCWVGQVGWRGCGRFLGQWGRETISERPREGVCCEKPITV
jgi:hypothetical protein